MKPWQITLLLYVPISFCVFTVMDLWPGHFAHILVGAFVWTAVHGQVDWWKRTQRR